MFERKNIYKSAFEKHFFADLAILMGATALFVICITFVLCCVEVLQNDQEKKENGDGGKYSHKGYPSFRAQINK